MPFLADVSEYMPPAGNGSWTANLMYYAVFVAAISTVVKQWLPKPPLTEQLEKLKDWVAQYFTSRTRHDGLKEQFESRHQENLDRFDALAEGMKGLREEIHDGNESVKTAGEERMSKLSDKILDLANAVSEVRGEVKRIVR